MRELKIMVHPYHANQSMGRQEQSSPIRGAFPKSKFELRKYNKNHSQGGGGTAFCKIMGGGGYCGTDWLEVYQLLG